MIKIENKLIVFIVLLLAVVFAGKINTEKFNVFTAVASENLISISPDTSLIDFGKVDAETGEKMKKKITVTNVSDKNLTLGFSIINDESSNFFWELEEGSLSNNELLPGGSQSVSITFGPMESNMKFTAAFAIEYNPAGVSSQVKNITLKGESLPGKVVQPGIKKRGEKCKETIECEKGLECYALAKSEDDVNTEPACWNPNEDDACLIGKKAGDSCSFGKGKCEAGEDGYLTCVTGGDAGGGNGGGGTGNGGGGGNTPFVVFESQCKTGQVKGEQKNCTNKNDSRILQEQCKAVQYKSDTKCATMKAYLTAMTDDCNTMKPSGVTCSVIDDGGFYGREASAFADFYINKSGNGGSGNGGGNGGGSGSGKGVYIPGSEIGLSDKSIQEILINLLTWALEVVGVLALLGFVISGVQYIIASGNENVMENAKRNMTYAIIGVIVVLASVVIIKAIENILRAKSLI